MRGLDHTRRDKVHSSGFPCATRPMTAKVYVLRMGCRSIAKPVLSANCLHTICVHSTASFHLQKTRAREPSPPDRVLLDHHPRERRGALSLRGLLDAEPQHPSLRPRGQGSKHPLQNVDSKVSNFKFEAVLLTGSGGHRRVFSWCTNRPNQECRTPQDAGFQQEHFTGHTPNSLCRDSAFNFSAEPRICIPPWAGASVQNHR